MQALKRKLNNKRGASMILVLALFLICTVVSSLVISAAASGTSRNAKRVAQQQSYLAISSATDMFRQELELGASYVGTEKHVNYGCITDCVERAEIAYILNGRYERQTGKRLDSKYIWYPLDEAHLMIEKAHNTLDIKAIDEERSYFNGDLIANLLKRAAKSIYFDGEAYTEQIEIEVEGDERLPKVLCEFKMDVDYTITMQFRTESTQYAMLITCKPERRDTSASTVDATSDVHQVYYKHFNESNGTFVDMVKDVPIDVTTTTTITTVTWDEVSVEKGVLGDD